MFRRDAVALVADCKAKHGPGFIGRKANRDRCAFLAIFEGIAEEIVHDLRQLRPITVDQGDIGRKLDQYLVFLLATAIDVEIARFPDQLAEINLFRGKLEFLRLDSG